MDEKQLQEKYFQLKNYEENIKALDMQLKQVDAQLAEFDSTIEALDELEKQDAPIKSLVPISQGIFLSAEIKNTKELILNVGSDVMVTKSIDETKQIINKQKQELMLYKDKAVAQMAAIDSQSQKLEQELSGFM